MHPLSLSVLDFINLSPAGYRQDILSIIRAAQVAEEAGFDRYWLTEHHAWCASASPEILLASIASATRRIKVGVAGVLLRIYHPHKVASTFQTLATLFPGRIDLGICNGRPGPTALARLQCGPAEVPFDRKVARLQEDLAGAAALADGLPPPCSPALWMLGTGRASMQLAHTLAIPYCHSLFHAGACRPPERDDTCWRPLAGLAVAGTCADDVGDLAVNPFVVPTVTGSAANAAQQLVQLARTYGADHIIWHEIARTRGAQCASIRNLAQALADLGMLKAA